MKRISLLFFYCLFWCQLFSQTNPVQVISPDTKLVIKLWLSEPEKALSYAINYNNKPVIVESRFGLKLNTNGWNNWNSGIVVKKTETRTQDTTWTPVYGERNVIHDRFNETTISLGIEGKPRLELNVIVRAYNEGIAFRYQIPQNNQGWASSGPYVSITDETTEFTFPDRTQAWFTPRAQSLYQLLPLNDWPGESERPLTLQLTNGLFASLAEAQLTDYARTKFKVSKDKSNTIQTAMYGEVDEIAPFATPWRMVMVAETPGNLLENNDMILNLNAPCEIINTSYIKPGKVIRLMPLTTADAKKMIDFAVEHNISYVHFDDEYCTSSYIPKVYIDHSLSPDPRMDIFEAIRYAKAKGRGVFVYLNQRALTNQLDTLLPFYKSMGIDGIKFGFVQVGAHRWTTWLHEAIQKCAKYEMMLDIHDEFRPTGVSRTYPNLMTQEGIYGNEEMPDATNNTILPFTRFLAGAADYTFCYFKRLEILQAGTKSKVTKNGDGNEVAALEGRRYIKNTAAHQLALPIVYFSPLQFLFWYDKPEDYQGEPELALWDVLPTSWDDTKVLSGEIGKYISIARRSGETWFLGSITNVEAREWKVALSFLEKGKKYEATIYVDDPSVQTRTHVGIQKIKVDSNTQLNIKLLASGGQAVMIKPL
jgi:alpha-glucosidase